MTHSYRQLPGLQRVWRLPQRLPGRQLLAAIWGWM